MANKFEMQITAVDRATAVINRVNASMSEMGKPVTETTKRMKAMTTALGRNPIAKTMNQIGKSGLLVARNLGAAIPPFTALTGAGALAGVTALAVGVERIAKAWAEAGYGIHNASIGSALNLREYQGLVRAGQLAHVDEDAMSSGLQELHKDIIDAKTNDPAKLTALKTFGVDPSMSTRDALLKISEGISSGKLDIVRQREAMSMLGLQDMLPLLQRGPAGIKSLEKKGLGYGGLQTETDANNRMRSTDVLKGWLVGTEAFGSTIINSLSETIAKGVGRQFGNHPPLGVRQNNLWNLRRWGGVPSENGFAHFSSIQAGAAAMNKQLQLYGSRGIDTLSAIVPTFAPKSDNNDVAGYIRDVAKDTGFDPNSHLNLNDPNTRYALMSSMARRETGANLSVDAIRQIVEQSRQEPQKMEITLHGLPAGVTATARNQHGNVPVKVATAMPVGGP